MGYNLFDSVEMIKSTMFAGEGTFLSLIAKSLACMFAGFALVKLYNDAMNTPYGMFNYSSALRMFFVLLLVCNFNSFVLRPVDSLMTTLAKGIVGGVTQDKSSMQSQMADLYKKAEDILSDETLYGQYNRALEGMTSTATESDYSGDTNPMMESSAESDVSSGKKKGFWASAWDTVKTAVSSAVGFPITSLASILSWLTSTLVIVVRYILSCVSMIYCIILGLLGPLIFAFSLLPTFESGMGSWFARYVQISMWVPMAAIIDSVNFKMKDALLADVSSLSIIDKLTFPTFHIILLDLVSLVMLLAIPSICGWIIQSSGASDVNGTIANGASRAIRAIATKH